LFVLFVEMAAKVYTNKFFCCLSLRTGTIVILVLIALRLLLLAIEYSIILTNEWDTPYTVGANKDATEDIYNKTLGFSLVYEEAVQSIYFEKIIEALIYLIPVVIGFGAVRKENPLWLAPITIIIICDACIGIVNGMFNFLVGVHWISIIGPFIASLIFKPYFAIVLISYINQLRNTRKLRIRNNAIL